MTIRILATDANLNVVGRPITQWTSVDVVGKLNYPEAISVAMPAYPHIMATLNAADRLVVLRGTSIFAAGPIERPDDPYQWAVSGQGGGDTDGPGGITVTAGGDLAYLSERITYPDPANDIDAQTVAYWTMTGTGEAILRALVDDNAGAGALAYRQVPQLTLGAPTGAGSTITVSTRVEQLTDALRRVALLAGGLVVEVRQVGTQLVFNVRAPQDLSSRIRFSRGLGNLRGLSLSTEAPTLTTAIVGGQGEGVSRTFLEVPDSAAVTRWRRIEQFIDQRNTNDTTELTQAGTEALAQAAERAQLSTVTVDTPGRRYGMDFQLGDRVSMVVRDGLVVTDLVRGYHLQATAKGGELLTVMVGTQEASSDPRWLRISRELARQLGVVQRS